MRFDEECICSLKKQVCEKKARSDKGGRSTFFVEAAIAVLRTGLFNVPGSDGVWNARQCLGF